MAYPIRGEILPLDSFYIVNVVETNLLMVGVDRTIVDKGILPNSTIRLEIFNYTSPDSVNYIPVLFTLGGDGVKTFTAHIRLDCDGTKVEYYLNVNTLNNAPDLDIHSACIRFVEDEVNPYTANPLTGVDYTILANSKTLVFNTNGNIYTKFRLLPRFVYDADKKPLVGIDVEERWVKGLHDPRHFYWSVISEVGYTFEYCRAGDTCGAKVDHSDGAGRVMGCRGPCPNIDGAFQPCGYDNRLGFICPAEAKKDETDSNSDDTHKLPHNSTFSNRDRAVYGVIIFALFLVVIILIISSIKTKNKRIEMIDRV